MSDTRPDRGTLQLRRTPALQAAIEGFAQALAEAGETAHLDGRGKPVSAKVILVALLEATRSYQRRAKRKTPAPASE